MNTVVLHVGLMKSGTTFVQDLLSANRAGLADQGVVVPGKQGKAVRDVLRPHGGGRDGAWARLVEEIAAGPPRAVVSMEFLGPARETVIQRVVSSLRPARVEVVCTVRDLNRNLPAMWQETVQNGRSWTWPDYLAGVRAARPDAPAGDPGPGDPEAGQTFWRQQDAVRICRSWASYADRTTVVTVPPPGAASRELLERFAQAAGLDPSGLVPGTPANESIGAASTQALRALNEILQNRGSESRAGRVRKRVLAKQVLAGRRGEEARIGLDVADWVRVSATVLQTGLQQLPVELIGAWTDLDPVPVDGIDPAAVPAEQVTEAAIAALAALVERDIAG